MAKLSSLRSDLSRESSGIEIQYPGTDIVCLIARIGNPAYEEHAKRLRRTARAKFSTTEITELQAKQAIAPAIAQHVLKDVRNLQDDAGNAVTYTPEYGEAMLRDPSFHDFYDWVLECARNAELFKVSAAEEVKGN